MATISIFNAKGGIGKTTSAYNLATGLKRFGDKRVLLIDMDPQGHAGLALGIIPNQIHVLLSDVLQGKADVENALHRDKEGIDVLPSNVFLAEAELVLAGIFGREQLLAQAIEPIKHKYDHIIIDCPPSVGLLSVNALMTSDYVIIPVEMSYFTLMGIVVVERTLVNVKERLRHPIELLGALPTFFDKRFTLTKETYTSLQEHFGEKLFDSIIPRTQKIKEAPGYGQSIYEYAPKHESSAAYQTFVEEVLARV